MSGTTVIRIPNEIHQQASRIAALCGEQPGVLLAHAWREYVANHRDSFAADLEKAAELMRNGTLDDLVAFAQDSHRALVVVDADELEAAERDPEVAETLARADAAHDRLVREGRDHEF